MISKPEVAVVGAGVSGAACAARLRDSGIAVTVFDKSRGVGGRLATRRVTPWQWDHGAQYFTAESSEFRQLLDRLPTWDVGSNDEWRVGSPSQNQLVKLIAEDITPTLETRIEQLLRHGTIQWQLHAEDSIRYGPFDAVALAIPAAQAAQLLPASHQFIELNEVEMAPCWALMIATPDPIELPSWLESPHEHIAWFAADHSKPGRRREYGQYVVHATADWSRAHLEHTREQVQTQLLEYMFEIIGPVDVSYATAHRWRYALTSKPLGKPFLLDDSSCIGICGDWCLGDRAEHAYLSGVALGKTLACNLTSN